MAAVRARKARGTQGIRAVREGFTKEAGSAMAEAEVTGLAKRSPFPSCGISTRA
jgi:hypothetical protein